MRPLSGSDRVVRATDARLHSTETRFDSYKGIFIHSVGTKTISTNLGGGKIARNPQQSYHASAVCLSHVLFTVIYSYLPLLVGVSCVRKFFFLRNPNKDRIFR